LDASHDRSLLSTRVLSLFETLRVPICVIRKSICPVGGRRFADRRQRTAASCRTSEVE
jgi:hypothetical protein